VLYIFSFLFLRFQKLFLLLYHKHSFFGRCAEENQHKIQKTAG